MNKTEEKNNTTGVDMGELYQAIDKAQRKGIGEIALTSHGKKIEVHIPVRDSGMVEFILARGL